VVEYGPPDELLSNPEGAFTALVEGSASPAEAAEAEAAEAEEEKLE
jgi:hypothetical protein